MGEDTLVSRNKVGVTLTFRQTTFESELSTRVHSFRFLTLGALHTRYRQRRR